MFGSDILAKKEAAIARGDAMKVFDWDKAARLIKERKPDVASAGLGGDWNWTGGDIYRDGAPVPSEKTYTYLASVWATPELDMDGDVVACWVSMAEKPEWDAGTYWPDSALAILNE